MATWHDQFNLYDGAVCWCQANREAHSVGGGESLRAEIETAEKTINAALRALFIINHCLEFTSHLKCQSGEHLQYNQILQ